VGLGCQLGWGVGVGRVGLDMGWVWRKAGYGLRWGKPEGGG